MFNLWAIFKDDSSVANYTTSQSQAKRYATINGYSLIGYTNGERKWVTDKKENGKWVKVLERYGSK